MVCPRLKVLLFIKAQLKEKEEEEVDRRRVKINVMVCTSSDAGTTTYTFDDLFYSILSNNIAIIYACYETIHSSTVIILKYNSSSLDIQSTLDISKSNFLPNH